ncbi:MAG: dipeptide ABC transporter ATP-binding protein [Inquilinus sp.]|uniref:dipeptide ABC transporter ATP-binding protein n=1 Tax=Inquilinus sp. TaxID=1932117 RepID=UPI003F31A656
MNAATPASDAPPQPVARQALVTIAGLTIADTAAGGRRVITTPTDLVVGRGETIAIVGESGSGKSLTAKAIARLLPANLEARGSVLFDGIDLMRQTEPAMRALRGRRISLMFQDPFTMLNPLLPCGTHVEEMLPRGMGRAARKAEVLRRLEEVGIPDPAAIARLRPFQLSGGLRQRVALAAALARDPDLLIADEPSTALDATTQKEVIDLLQRVQRQRGMSLILITHDLRLAFSACERVHVFYAGSLVEVGPAHALEREPFHPYTLGLLLSEPPVDRRLAVLTAIPGSVPGAEAVADRCPFEPRCSFAADRCRAAKPPLAPLSDSRLTACVRFAEIRPAIAEALSQGRSAAPRLPDVAGDAVPPLLRVAGLVKSFGPIRALKGTSIEVGPGDSVGLVGESGSGKTTLGRCVVGLERAEAGRIELDGHDASDYRRIPRPELASLRRSVQMIFQDPYATLNPKHTVRSTLAEALSVSGTPARQTEDEIARLLAEVGLKPALADRLPASLSGGERQRVSIARALAVKPKLLVCDEPVSALDVSVQAQILNLLKRIQAEHGLALLFITHDLAVLRQICDRVYVLFRGDIVEQGATADVMDAPQHPYTRRLIAAIPRT